VIRGNRLHERGRYEEAAAAYLSLDAEGQGQRFSEVINFDLANVYARLGEYPAAAALYDELRKSGEPRLCAASWYNEGLILYEKGRYAEAYRAFRAALAIDPRDADARRNLELAWRDWQRHAAAPPERAAASERKAGGNADDELRLLRRLETGRFRPGGASAAPPSPEDY
jgi:tetratricopeptide (TPR) repeat protein